MRIRARYAVAAGILAASFSMLGPLAQASQISGTSVPATSDSSAAKTDVMPGDLCYLYGVGYSPGVELCVNHVASTCDTDGGWNPVPGTACG